MKHQDLKEKAMAATSGPWALGGSRGNAAHVWGAQGSVLIAECDRSKSLSHLARVANSGFIAAANPNAVLALIEENEKLQAVLELHVNEWLCDKCNMVHLPPKSILETLCKCGNPMRPSSINERNLEAKNAELLAALKGVVSVWDDIYPDMESGKYPQARLEDAEFTEIQRARNALIKAGIGAIK